jgi:hypothetical protein
MAAPNWEALFNDYDKDLEKIEQDRKDKETAIRAECAAEEGARGQGPDDGQQQPGIQRRRGASGGL